MILKINTLLQYFNSDLNIYLNLLNINFSPNISFSNNYLFSNYPNFSAYILWYYDIVLTNIIWHNVSYFLLTIKTYKTLKFSSLFFFFINFFFKITFFVYLLLIIFFLTNLENYIKQLSSLNAFNHISILNHSEKDVGPVDDYLLFAILFTLTISLFIFSAVFFIVFQSNIILWAIGGFFILTILILTIPVNLFIDFGIIVCTAVRGSASGNNFIKELIFDIISITTVFIRFIIQNIRFFFIFSGIFELLEWTISNNSTLFTSFDFINNNVFLNTNFFNLSLTSFNLILLNSILFILLYFYYILHLLFLLLVQVTVYLGISIWLFFFLYSTKFLTNFEKYLLIKKNL